MKALILIIVSAVFVNNFVLSRFLGICPFLGVSRRIRTAAGMSAAVIVVMTIVSAATWVLDRFVLVRFHLEYLQTATFVLAIVALVQAIQTALLKTSPTLYKALGIYLPLVTANCAVLGVAVLGVRKEYGLVEATLFGFGSAVGFGFVTMIFSGIRERMELCDIPVPLRGTAIGLVTAGLLSLAFMGFTGLVR